MIERNGIEVGERRQVERIHAFTLPARPVSKSPMAGIAPDETLPGPAATASARPQGLSHKPDVYKTWSLLCGSAVRHHGE